MTRRSFTLPCILAAALGILAAPGLRADTFATLTGIVTDPSGGDVPGAVITLTHLNTNVTYKTESNEKGIYRISTLPPGVYRASVSKDGFKAIIKSEIELHVQDVVSVNFALQLGSVVESVTVEAGVALVNTQSGTLSQIVERKYIQDLPLNGRNAATLVKMVPGTVPNSNTDTATYANTSETMAFSVNGTRGNEVNFRLDGATHMDNVTNLNAIYPNPDAVQEFTVQTSNYSAQFGSFAGAVVNVVTKSGSNAFHGSGFEFVRNGSMNARNYFAAQHDNLKRNQFGGGLGGPVIHDRLFFFGSYQATLVRNTSYTNMAYVPSAAQRRGDFSGRKAIFDPDTQQPFEGNRIPDSRMVSASSKLLELVPTSTDPSGLLRFARPDRFNSQQALGRGDYTAGRHSLSGRLFYVRYSDPGWDGGGTLLNSRIGQFQTTASYQGQYTFTARPNLVNTAVFSVLRLDSHNTNTSLYSLASFGEPKYTLPPEADRQMQLTLTGYSGWGSLTNAPPGKWIRRNVELSDTLIWVKGQHTFSFGGEFTPNITFDSNTKYRQTGAFTFSGQLAGDAIADLLLGRVASFTQSAGKFKQTRGSEFSLFAEDAYRASRSLTVTLGLRWEPFLPYHDELKQVAGYQQGAKSQRFVNAPPGAIFAGDPGFPDSGMYANMNNFSPRFGFAWTPRPGSDSTVLRGGYGVFYVRPFPRLYNNFVESSPFSPSVTLNGVDMLDPYGSSGVRNPFPPFAPGSLTQDVPFSLPMAFAYFDTHWHVGYTQAWNLNVEQQIAHGLLLRVAYVGNKGTHLQDFHERNAAVYGSGATVGNTQARRPLSAYYASIMELTNSGDSVYHSAQITVDKRFSRNFSVLGFYTFSKAIDDGSVNSQFVLANPNPYNGRFSRGVSDYDIPHNLRITGIYELPRLAAAPGWMRRTLGGWSISEILDWRSGTPFSLPSGLDNSFSGIGLDYSDLLGDPHLPDGRPRDQMLGAYFDASKVTANKAGTFGTAPRNCLRGPRFFNIDASVQKNVAVTDRLQVQLRGEFFNLLNHAQFQQPGNTFKATSSFGKITAAYDPRIVQLGARLTF